MPRAKLSKEIRNSLLQVPPKYRMYITSTKKNARNTKKA